MGNTSQSGTASNTGKTKVNSQQNVQIYEETLRLLSNLCANDQFPLSAFQQKNDMSTEYRVMEIISSPRQSDEFSNLMVKLFFNGRKMISRNEVTKLFYDCCIFDLKQALNSNTKQLQIGSLDNQCLSALAAAIEPKTAMELEEKQFYDWIRVQFPTLFYGFELWLRKYVARRKSEASSEQSIKNYSLMSMNNILNFTWIWLLTHQLPILYLSADNTCTNLFERMRSVLYGRMWDHLYDSYKDGSSLNRFQHHIFGYKGPIIILFEISDGYLFCLCCDEEFRESPKPFGSIQACLLQLKPVFKMIVEGEHIIFMNTKLRGVSELGLFIGRDRTRPFLNIDGDFFNAKHLNGEGRLIAIDVWGVGGKASAEEQNDMRQWEEKQIEKSRKVKRSYEEEEAILNMAGIETRHTQEQF